MRCTYPRTVGRKTDGTSLAWSPKEASKEYATVQLPCGQCLDCLLEHARQWALRCKHEAQMHRDSCFITLTYRDECLESPWLIYGHWQDFMKKVRHLTDERLSVVVCGEYGEKTKRPHWHALIFGYQFPDLKYLRTNENGDRIFKSDLLDETWGFNDPVNKPCEVGAVTEQSAGYVCRYAAKKLVHGRPGEHPYNPIFKASNKNAIGKSWIERYWRDVFHRGRVVLDGGVSCSVPRYYEKWFKEHKPIEWRRYVTEVKVRAECEAAARAAEEERRQREVNFERSCKTARDGAFRGHVTSRAVAHRAITKAKFEKLQEKLKL